MGHVVTLASLPTRAISPAVAEAPITDGDLKEMSAKFFRIEAGARLAGEVPAGSDGYFYALGHPARIAVDGKELALDTDSFAAVREGRTFALSATAAGAAEIVHVLAPPAGGAARGLKGLAGDLTVIARSTAPETYVADQKKLRRYFVSHEAAKSERAHAMIVEYERDTHTAMHHHPNAESMFVMLTGRVQFTVNGEKQVLERGQAVYFGANDKHALQCAEGATSASFLEFHIPAAFTTVKA